MEMCRCPSRPLPPTTVHTGKRTCPLATDHTRGPPGTPAIVTMATFILTCTLAVLTGIGAAGGTAVTSGSANDREVPQFALVGMSAVCAQRTFLSPLRAQRCHHASDALTNESTVAPI